MKGVTFGEYHSYNDLHLILTEREIGSPEVKTSKIEIAGADSALDLTDFFGEPKYSDVKHKFNFSTIVSQAQFPALFSTVKSALHGKKMRVILDDDPLFYYMGRLAVSGFTTEKRVGKITVEADCDPYKYKLSKTVLTSAVNGTTAITLTNSRKRAVPTVNVEAANGLNIAFQSSNVWDLNSGTYTLPELELAEGANTVTVTGTGTITFTWQEASL